MDYELTPHASEEIARRGIPLELVEATLYAPQQIVPSYGRRRVYQSIVEFGVSRLYLLRLVVDDSVHPSRVITAYRTSRVEKYWKDPL